MADLFPQVAGTHGLGDLAVHAADQFPVRVLLDRLQEGVGHADRVVRVLARHRVIGFRVPVGIVGREFDAGVALLGIVQHALDVGFRDRDLLGFADRGLQAVVLCGVEGVSLGAVPGLDGGEDAVQHLLVHLGPGDDAGDLLLLENLPLDEVLDIRVIGVNDHHLRCPTGGPA